MISHQIPLVWSKEEITPKYTFQNQNYFPTEIQTSTIYKRKQFSFWMSVCLTGPSDLDFVRRSLVKHVAGNKIGEKIIEKSKNNHNKNNTKN